MGVRTLHVAHTSDRTSVAVYTHRNDDSRHFCEHKRDAENTDLENLQPLIRLECNNSADTTV